MVFKYAALNISGVIEEGKLETTSYLEAVTLLHQKGLLPVEVSGGKAFDRGVFDQILIFKNLAVLLESGVSLNQALKLLAGKFKEDRLKVVLGDVHKRVGEGRSLQEALSNHPDIFSKVSVGMLDSTNLSRSLGMAALNLFEEYELRVKERARMAYPIILFVIFIIGIIVSSLILSGRL
jgi:general secretion pathway protein F